MATYRINGVKYNPANWAMLEKAERAACARFAAARERELNTIETNEHPCTGGPFDGAVIELHSMASAPIHVGAWVGHYQAANTVTGCAAEWVGTDGGQAVNTHGTSAQAKAAPEVTGQGFDQLRDLLADLAEDPAERQKTISMRNVSITWPVGAVDDFGDLITGEVPTHCNQSMEFIRVTGRGKNKQRVYAFTTQPGHGTGFMNDFGQLTKAPATRTHGANFPRAIEQITHTIGRTRYTINATPEAAANLRARILKAKKWFADKCLTAAKPTAAPVPTPAEAVAALVADAVAAVAIDAAQTTARADELSQVATVADEVACMAEACADAMADGVACMPRAEHSGQPSSHTPTGAGFATPGSGQPAGTHAGSQPPAPRAEAAETRATPTATESEAQEKPTVATLVNAGIHPAIADTISRCGISAYGPLAQTEIRTKLAVAMGGTPGHTNTGHATPAQRSSAPGAAGGAGGQRVAGKSGRWSAVLHTTPAGLPGMVYTGPDGTPTAHEFDTGRQRMAALQRLAQSADKSNDFPNPGDEYSVYAGAWLRMKFLYKKEKTTTSNELYYFSNGSIATVVKVDELHERVKATTEADAGPSGTLTAPHTPTPSEPNGPDTHGVCAAGATDYTHPLKTLGGDYTDPLKTLTGDVHAKTANQPSHPRNIVPENGTRIAEDAFEAWTFHQEKTGRFGFVMYLGKQSKPYAYYAYATEAKRDAGFERHAQQARDILASKAKRKAEDRAKLDAGHALQVGDVVRSSWGYDQTNVDHYQIIKVIGKRTVEVRALAVHEESTGDMSGRVAPVWGEFVGEVMRRQVDKHGNVNMLSASYGRASKIEPVAVVHGVRCYAATHYSSYA